jgi:hypothetical protein
VEWFLLEYFGIEYEADTEAGMEVGMTQILLFQALINLVQLFAEYSDLESDLEILPGFYQLAEIVIFAKSIFFKVVHYKNVFG